MTANGLAAALEGLERGAARPEDVSTVHAAIEAAGGAVGAGAVTVGGDANNTTIHTDVHIGDKTFNLHLTPELLEVLRPTPAASTLFNLPDAPRHFVGRSREEAQLLEALSRGDGSQAIVGLRGVGGIGKMNRSGFAGGSKP